MLVALVAGAVVVFTGDHASATEVALEGAGSEGTDPFMDSIATDTVDPDGIEPGGVEQISTNPDQPVANISGATPGLYGGTGNDAVCDPTALVDFLDNHPDKAQAFASVQGIQPDAISDFVATLTPVLLREDTRVTNHGFNNGTATPLQSVLQAGTAVLVDNRGVPRVRCACGNPLTEPAAQATNLTFTGTTWNGFDNTRLVAVEPAPQPLDTLTITDIDTGQTQDITTGSTTAIPVTVDQLASAEVPSLCGFPPGQLVDGSYPGLDPVLEGSASASLAIVGDFTDDGVDDGLMITSCNNGGTAFANQALTYSDGAFLAEVPVEDGVPPGSPYGVAFDTARIVDGTIEVDALTWTASDAHCCPSLSQTVRFQWDGTQFVAA